MKRVNPLLCVLLLSTSIASAGSKPKDFLDQPVISILVAEYSTSGALTDLRSVTGRYVGIREELRMEQDPPTKGMVPVTVVRKVRGVETTHHGWVPAWTDLPKKKEKAKAKKSPRQAPVQNTNVNVNVNQSTSTSQVVVPRGQWDHYHLPPRFYYGSRWYDVDRWYRCSRTGRYCHWCPYRHRYVYLI